LFGIFSCSFCRFECFKTFDHNYPKYINKYINVSKIMLKLPMSSNKDTSEKNQVAEEWRSLNQEKTRFYCRSIGSFSISAILSHWLHILKLNEVRTGNSFQD
jgi:hypothetical protein